MSSVVCNICNQEFSSKTKLFKHLEIHGFIGDSSKESEKSVLLIGWLSSESDSNDWIKEGNLSHMWTIENSVIEYISLAIQKVDNMVSVGESNKEYPLKGVSRASGCFQVIIIIFI